MGIVVETKYGNIEGLERGGIHAFRGVPFAASTAGDRRFRPPAAPEPWSGTRDATVFGPPAAQVIRTTPAGPSMLGEWSEDCLNLNVWTPGCDGAARPVMVWVHGGSYVSGSGATALYTGSRLARRGDVVTVTINYRLGALGFLAHPDLVDEETGNLGNLGLLDQIAALQWVQDHIERFGGDPTNVTLFGESAGGMGVSTLLSTAASTGLFHRAIAQSGPPIAATTEQAAEVAEQVAAAAGVASVAGLRSLPASAVIDAQARAFADLAAEVGVPFKPVVDGALLPRMPIEGIAAGVRADVPLIVGTNRDEAKLWLMMFPELLQVDEGSLREQLATSVAGAAEAKLDEALVLYRRLRSERGESITPVELLAAIGTDSFFLAGSTQVAERHAAHQPATFNYLFTHETPAFGGMLGSCHALDVPFVFGTHTLKGMELFAGEGADVNRLSGDMQDAWLAFARTGNPSQPDLEWHPYDAERRATMVFATRESRMQDAPLEVERAFWAD